VGRSKRRPEIGWSGDGVSGKWVIQMFKLLEPPMIPGRDGIDFGENRPIVLLCFLGQIATFIWAVVSHLGNGRNGNHHHHKSV
jgi:hypothetical protein